MFLSRVYSNNFLFLLRQKMDTFEKKPYVSKDIIFVGNTLFMFLQNENVPTSIRKYAESRTDSGI